MDRAKGARSANEPRDNSSGIVQRRRETSELDARGHSQLRRRLDLEAEESTPAPRREPGFLEDEPEDGVPTPRRSIPLSAVPKRIVGDAELLSLPLDHRAGFVLAHVDGSTDIATLIDLCGMGHDALVALVQQLMSLRVIRLA